MSDTLHLTVVYEDAGEGWIMASIPELPGVITQGRAREEARFMIRDALREMLLARAQVGSPPTLSRPTPTQSRSSWSSLPEAARSRAARARASRTQRPAEGNTPANRVKLKTWRKPT